MRSGTEHIDDNQRLRLIERRKMTRAELFELARLLRRLGDEVELEKEEAEAYPPDTGTGDDMLNLYIPKVPKGFYCDPHVFRRLLGIE